MQWWCERTCPVVVDFLGGFSLFFESHQLDLEMRRRFSKYEGLFYATKLFIFFR